MIIIVLWTPNPILISSSFFMVHILGSYSGNPPKGTTKEPMGRVHFSMCRLCRRSAVRRDHLGAHLFFALQSENLGFLGLDLSVPAS